MEQAADPVRPGTSPILAAVIGGGVAGAIDIFYAVGASSAKGVAPTRVLQSVASGLLGREAYQGGVATALIGLLLHFAMTVVMAAIFVAAARSVVPVRQHLMVAGLIYGALIYFAMRWVIVPLSRFPGEFRTVNPTELAVHIFGVGLVIALAARRFAGG